MVVATKRQRKIREKLILSTRKKLKKKPRKTVKNLHTRNGHKSIIQEKRTKPKIGLLLILQQLIAY